MKNIIILIILIGIIFTNYGKIKNTPAGSDIKITFDSGRRSGGSENDRIGSKQKPTTNIVAENKAIVLGWQEPIAEKIRATFKDESDIAIATFRAESGLRAEAQGWNCSYGACRIEDRDKAWSTDCGIAQLNFPGSICPAESFDPDWNIQKAYEWKYLPNKKAGGTGFGPWVAHATGRYLVFLKK